MTRPPAATPDDFKMTLWQHLEELRSRLFRIAIGVLVLGTASLVFSRELYGLLMRPVLMALPPGSSSLIYTSAIEEINVLMRIGLYAGLFLSTPILLWQVWGFVAPGLYERERKLAGPFVLLGTVAFLSGATFCYLVMLPQMFQFLLQHEDAAAVQRRLAVAKLEERDLLRFVQGNDLARASALGRAVVADLRASGDGQVPVGDWQNDLFGRPGAAIELQLQAMGRLIDALQVRPGNDAAPLLEATERHLAAARAWSDGDWSVARTQLEACFGALAKGAGDDAAALRDVWEGQRQVAGASAYEQRLNWTRPMLSMSEQLTLVLVLELAFGVIFELPLVMLLLALMGLVTSRFFFKYQRHAIVVCLIIAAVVTPTGDVVNLSLMAGPMLLCYEVGVLLVWLAERRRTASATASGAKATPEQAVASKS